MSVTVCAACRRVMGDEDTFRSVCERCFPPGKDSAEVQYWKEVARVRMAERDSGLTRATELEAEINRLKLLLIRKNEALGLFGDPEMWNERIHGDNDSEMIWFGANSYADPIAFAKREASATEPDNRGESFGS